MGTSKESTQAIESQCFYDSMIFKSWLTNPLLRHEGAIAPQYFQLMKNAIGKSECYPIHVLE